MQQIFRCSAPFSLISGLNSTKIFGAPHLKDKPQSGDNLCRSIN